MHAETDVTL